MKNKTFLSLFLIVSALSSNIYTVHNEAERKTDCARFRHAIKKMEFYLNFVQSELDTARMPFHQKELLEAHLKLQEHEVKMLKSIHYFRNLLKTNYCTEVE